MNRMAERIPVRYVALLSLFVMVLCLVWYAPAPAAAATTDSTTIGSSTSPPSKGSAGIAEPTSVSSTLTSSEPRETTPSTSSSGDKITETPQPHTEPSDTPPTSGGGQVTNPAGDDGPTGGTNDGGTSGGGGAVPGGGTSGGTGGPGVGGNTPPPAPQPAPSGSSDPSIPTVEVPPGGAGVPGSSPSPKPAPATSTAPSSPPASGGTDSGAGAGSGTGTGTDSGAGTGAGTDSGTGTDSGAGTGTGGKEPASKVEKIVLVPGDSKTPSVLAGSEVSAEIEGADGDGKYRVVSGELPPGLMLDSKTGKITGTAQQVGTYSFTIEYGSKHQSAIQHYTIRVAERPTSIQTPPLEPARTGQPYEAVVLHTQGGIGPFTYKLKGSELGGSKEAVTSLRTAPWVAGHSHQAADVLGGSSKLQDAGPLVQSVADSEGGSGVDLDRSRVGNLPAGMRLEGGVLTGKPKPEAAGSYTFTVISTDRYGSTDEQEMTITVLSEGDAVPITAGEDAEITSPALLADNAAGQAAAAEPDAGSAVLPMVLGLLLLGAGVATVAMRHRRTIGAHR